MIPLLKGTWFDVEARATKKEVRNAVIKMVETIKREHSLYRKEIKEWRWSRYIALDPNEPRRKRLQDLFDEIMTDAFIFGRWQTRMLRVSNKQLVIQDSEGNVDDEKTKLINKGWARRQTKFNMESIPYGYTLAYVEQLTDEGYIRAVDMLYRDHIVPQTCEILKSPEDRNGKRFDKAPYDRWCFWVNHKHSLGLLDKAAPLYIFKKHSWQNWDEFEEKFGIPMRIAKIASQDPKVQKEVDKWLKDLGSAAYARFPEGTELDIKETNSQDAFNVFNEKRKACNEELATLFDGHFETAKDSGSRAKAATLTESTQDQITLDDEAFNLDVWNDTIMPKLIELGYPFTEDDTVAYNENVVSTPKERLEIFKGVKELGHTVDKEQIASELDVTLVDAPEPPPEPTKPKEGSENLLPNFKSPHNHGDGCGAKGADYRVIAQVVAALTPDEEKLLKAIYAGKVTWDYKEFMASHGPLLNALLQGYARVGIDYGADDHKMYAFMRANIHRFGTDKTTAEIYQLNQILKDPKVDDYSKFRERALKLFPNYKEHWLRTEYQQVLTSSQMGERYQEMMQDADIAPYWRLVAIIDDGTTAICRSLHLKVFRKDNADTWRFLPSNHFGCRSDAEDVLEGYDGKVLDMADAVGLNPEAWAGMQKSGHDVNWGDAGEVFSASQSYLRRIQANELQMHKLTAVDFGLGKAFKSSLNAPARRFKWQQLADANGRVRLLDVHWQPRWAATSVLDAADDELVRAVPETLAAPDEIYHWEEKSDKLYRYLKHYKEFSASVLVRFDRKTSATITRVEKATPNHRRGLLVHHRPDAIALAKENYQKITDYNKEVFDERSGGWLAIHPEHGKNELAQNKAIALRLVAKGHGVQLLPDSPGLKTYDAMIDQRAWEFKTLTRYSNLKNRINKEVRNGAKQAPNILVAINGRYRKTDIANGLQGAVAQDKDKRIHSVALLFPDGRLVLMSRKDIEEKRASKLLNE